MDWRKRKTALGIALPAIENWIGTEVERAFAAAEAATFVTGNGVNKPKGFLSYPTVANTSWSWGNLGFTSTGIAGGFAAANPSDDGLTSPMR